MFTAARGRGIQLRLQAMPPDAICSHEEQTWWPGSIHWHDVGICLEAPGAYRAPHAGPLAGSLALTAVLVMLAGMVAARTEKLRRGFGLA